MGVSRKRVEMQASSARFWLRRHRAYSREFILNLIRCALMEAEQE